MPDNIDTIHSKIIHRNSLKPEELNCLLNQTNAQRKTVRLLLEQIDRDFLGSDLYLPPFWPEKNRAIIALLVHIHNTINDKITDISRASTISLNIDKQLEQTLEQFEKIDYDILRNYGMKHMSSISDKRAFHINRNVNLKNNISQVIKRDIDNVEYYKKLTVWGWTGLGLSATVLGVSLALTLSAFAVTGAFPTVALAVSVGSMVVAGFLLPTCGLLQSITDQYEQKLQTDWCEILIKAYSKVMTRHCLFKNNSFTYGAKNTESMPIPGSNTRFNFSEQNHNYHEDRLNSFICPVNSDDHHDHHHQIAIVTGQHDISLN